MAMSRRHRLIGLLIDLGVVAAFGSIWLFGGHGAAPVALLMFLGQGDWYIPMTLGWSGVVALLALPLVLNRWCYFSVAVIGLGMLSASLVIFISSSDGPAFSILFAGPFVGAAIARLVYLFVQATCWSEA
jgi:hypothetical protein